MSAKLVDKDTGWSAMLKRVKAAKDGRVKVGVLADDKKGGADHEGLTVAELAAVLHYGTSKIPARPFLAMAFDEHREELAKMGGHLIGGVLDGSVAPSRALGFMGAKLSAEAKKVITVGNRLVPNAPSTAVAKSKKAARAYRKYQSAATRLAKQVSQLNRKSRKLGTAFARIGRYAAAEAALGDAMSAFEASVAASRPLVDTGRLLGAITWAVDKDGR